MTSSYQDKKIAIVVDAFYPTKTSAAIQIYDLSIALRIIDSSSNNDTNAT